MSGGNSMYLESIGINQLHDGSYIVDRTDYFKTYLLLLLESSQIVL